MKALWQESHEYKLRRVLSVTRNRPSNVPDYAKSPYSNRTTGECGLYRAYSTKDTNEFYNLHGTEVAARHRQRGNELNSHIYPKSWQINKIDVNENQQETEEEVYDLKGTYHHSLWRSVCNHESIIISLYTSICNHQCVLTVSVYPPVCNNLHVTIILWWSVYNHHSVTISL